MTHQTEIDALGSISHDQLLAMLGLQSSINAKVNPDWVKAAYPYLRAAIVEGAEGMEHHGWKWWKAQKLDLPQLQMELVDIWHFILSDFLLRMNDIADAALECMRAQVRREVSGVVRFDDKNYDVAQLDTISKIELLIGLSVARRTSIVLFKALLDDCQMSWAEVFKQYVGKNVLNGFRQDHGYKDGSYRKTWNGREDNEHLSEIIATLDVEDPMFSQRLYTRLVERYAETA
jgi:hypothetical protein